MSKILTSEFMQQAIVKLKVNASKVRIENKIFLLFSKVTVSILFICCGLVTLQELIGDHIKCIQPPKEDLGGQVKALQQYCFIMSTYTLPHLYNKTLGVDMPHYGVGPYHEDNEEHEPKFHNYYQWVPFVLFFQGLFFLLPHYLWKVCEENRIKVFCNLQFADKIEFKERRLLKKDEEDSKTKKLSQAAAYFVGYLNYNSFYAYTYIVCEILNFIIVITNIYLTNAFLGYTFSTYGWDVVKFLSKDPENRMDPLNVVFPKVTKCDFHKYGPGGNLINYDVMCILALNILNEKIYTFLWFWFIILSVIGGLGLIYRLLVYFIPGFRNMVIKRRALPDDHTALDFIVNKLSYGDWFILKRVSDNLNRVRFGQLCQSIRSVMRDEKASIPQSPVGTPPPFYNSHKSDSLKDLNEQEDPLI